MGNQCCITNQQFQADESSGIAENRRKNKHQRQKSHMTNSTEISNLNQVSMQTSLQLINLESFLSELDHHDGQNERAVSGHSSDYGGADSQGGLNALNNRLSSKSARSNKGFPCIEELFYDAQKDYAERYVLGIDPRVQEQARNATATSPAAQTQPNNTAKAQQQARANSQFSHSANSEGVATQRTEATQPVSRQARYEGEIEKFSGHCFVLDPSMRAQGDTQIGYIGNILLEDTIECLIDTILQRKSMRMSSFRLSRSNQLSPGYVDDRPRQIPPEMQIALFQQL